MLDSSQAPPPAPSRERKGPKAPLQGPALALRVGGFGELFCVRGHLFWDLGSAVTPC